MSSERIQHRHFISDTTRMSQRKSLVKVGAVTAGFLALAAFIAAAFMLSPELQAFAADTVGSIDIIDESIQSVDIKNGQVKNADLAASAVTSGKLKDGEVKTADISNGAVTESKLSSSFIVHRTLLDDAGGNAAGWNPDGVAWFFIISDPAFDVQKSTVFINVDDKNTPTGCTVDLRGASGGNNFVMTCLLEPINGARLDYVIVTMPSTSLPASATASSATSEDITQYWKDSK